MRFEDLTEEQKAKAIGKSPEELFALAKEEGIELDDKDLEAVSGGWGKSADIDVSKKVKCPSCGSTYVEGNNLYTGTTSDITFSCKSCGYSWPYQ